MRFKSLVGNVAIKEGELHIHTHITVTDEQYQTLGGHLESAIISGACEITLQAINGAVDRVFDEETGLYLLKLE